MPARAFLGVAQSVMGRAWRDRCEGPAGNLALAIAQAHGLPDILSRVLAGRNVALLDVPVFLEPRLRDLLPDPYVLRDMEAAAERLADAVERRERVAIFGDYDVDGACSSALLGGFLDRCGVPFTVHIPDRITEGYGPNADAIRALRAGGASLLVTVDCGTASHEPFAVASEIGFDTIVLDHHQAPDEPPAVLAVVNPNRQDDLSGLGHLAAAGVVFLSLVALSRVLRRRGYWAKQGGEIDLLSQLDLVALATVADVVRLEGLNRAMVRQGLQVMRQRGRPGLTALLDIADLKGPPQAWHLGFLIGPRINAGGRIGDAALGARLLMTHDTMEAARIAAQLDQLNKERQAIEQIAVEEALAQAELALVANPDGALVAASDQWHPGIVGLVASRLKERFDRPAFAFALKPDGSGTGSGRSVVGVDLGRAVRRAVDAGVAVKGGGHAMAAGVTLPPGGVAAFTAYLSAAIADGLGGAAEAMDIDAAMTAGGAQPELVAMIERAGPFGAGNPEPVFVFPKHRLVEVQEVGLSHVRFKLKSGDGTTIAGIAFRAAGQPLGLGLQANRGELVHAAGTLAVDRWGGRERVDLRLRDLAPALR